VASSTERAIPPVEITVSTCRTAFDLDLAFEGARRFPEGSTIGSENLLLNLTTYFFR
jgi:hypothetical protein